MPQGLEKGAEPSLVDLDDAIIPVLRALLDQPTDVGGEEAIVIVKVEPLRVPLGIVRCQPSDNILLRLIHVPRLLDQVEAAGPHRLPHPCSPTRSTEQLTLEEVEPQLLVRHHSQVAFTHRGKDRRGKDCVGGEMLELDAVVME